MEEKLVTTIMGYIGLLEGSFPSFLGRVQKFKAQCSRVNTGATKNQAERISLTQAVFIYTF